MRGQRHGPGHRFPGLLQHLVALCLRVRRIGPLIRGRIGVRLPAGLGRECLQLLGSFGLRHPHDLGHGLRIVLAIERTARGCIAALKPSFGERLVERIRSRIGFFFRRLDLAAQQLLRGLGLGEPGACIVVVGRARAGQLGQGFVQRSLGAAGVLLNIELHESLLVDWG
ncbi:hypothetical protein D3C71_1199440 [compost metagenome]